MKLILPVSLAAILVTPHSVLAASAIHRIPPAGIPFITNAGQCDADILYYARTFNGAVCVTHTGAVSYALPAQNPTAEAAGTVLVESIVGGRLAPIRGVDRSAIQVSFFNGADAVHDCCPAATYERISLGEVYDGVEFSLQVGLNNVEKIFDVAPGASAELIRLRLAGADRLRVNARGELVVSTTLGEAIFTKPIAYQDIDGRRYNIEVAYDVDGLEYGFSFGAYDASRALVIDPLLAATYLGGSGTEGQHRGVALARGSDGSVYVTCHTTSSDFPTTPGVFGETFSGNYDVFVARFNADLTQLHAATYLGGSGNDGYQRGSTVIAVDDQGRVYVAGQTYSTNFPVTPGAYDVEYANEGDIFITRFNADLTEISASTYLGRNRYDHCRDILIEPGGTVLLAGTTRCTGFPTTEGAYCTVYAGNGNSPYGGDDFITRMDADLTTIIASTYLGGSGSEFDGQLALAPDGTIYITGTTASPDFPVTAGAYDETYNSGPVGDGCDAFVAHFSNDLSSLLALTYIGGYADDWGCGIALDDEGCVYLVGHTCSETDYPTTPGAFDTTYNGFSGVDVGDDAQVSKFDPDLTTLLASTFLGGDYWDIANDIAYDGHGHVYVAGQAQYCTNFPTTQGAFSEDHQGGGSGANRAGDAFISRLDTDLAVLSASTLYGGTGIDGLGSLLVDENGDVYFAGTTNSTDLPMTPGAYDDTFNGGASGAFGDIFVAKLDKILAACTGDLDGNGAIDLSDLAALLGHYGETTGATYADGDIDGDDDIDLSDLAALLSLYGDPCD